MAPWLKRFVTSEERAALRDVIDSFTGTVSHYQARAKDVDPALAGAIGAILERSGVERTLTRLAFQLRSAEHVDPIPVGDEVVYGVAWRLASQKTKTRYGDFLALSKGYRPLDQLITLLRRLEQIGHEPGVSDDSLFAPSRISVPVVVNLLNEAKNEVQGASLDDEAKRELLAYIEEARREVRRPRPAWTRVVGAIVIAAAVISAVADLPKAVEHLQGAAHYIIDAARVRQESLPEVGSSSVSPPIPEN